MPSEGLGNQDASNSENQGGQLRARNESKSVATHDLQLWEVHPWLRGQFSITHTGSCDSSEGGQIPPPARLPKEWIGPEPDRHLSGWIIHSFLCWIQDEPSGPHPLPLAPTSHGGMWRALKQEAASCRQQAREQPREKPYLSASRGSAPWRVAV